MEPQLLHHDLGHDRLSGHPPYLSVESCRSEDGVGPTTPTVFPGHGGGAKFSPWAVVTADGCGLLSQRRWASRPPRGSRMRVSPWRAL
jgi:hypothetical protein